MDDTPIPRNDFGSLDPLVFAEVCWDVDVFVVILITRSDGRFRNGKNDVGFDVPAAIEDRGGRKILRIALLGSGLDPLIDRGDFLVGETRVVYVVPYVRIGMPG